MSTPKKIRIMKDDDGHTYFVPVGKEKAFEEWVEAEANGEEYKGEDFFDCAIGCSLSVFAFDYPERT